MTKWIGLLIIVMVTLSFVEVAHAYGEEADTGVSTAPIDAAVRSYPSASPWRLKLGLGAAVSQLVSGEETRASAFQLNLGGMVERAVAGPLSAGGGFVLGMQLLAPPGLAANTQLVMRYLEIPAMVRLNVMRRVSFGLGGFAAVPLDPVDSLPLSKRLTTTDLGVAASIRWNVPVNRLMDWVFELQAQRGLWSLGAAETDAGSQPNHLRSFGALAGLMAAF